MARLGGYLQLLGLTRGGHRSPYDSTTTTNTGGLSYESIRGIKLNSIKIYLIRHHHYHHYQSNHYHYCQTITTTTITDLATDWLTMPGSWRSLLAISLRPHPRRLATSHPPGWSVLTRSVSTPGRHSTVARDEENDTSELDAEIFGAYSVILPPEPFIFGVSHIPQRPVPSHITRPPYITPSAHGQPDPCVPSGDGRIQLGSPGEWRLRRAAQLAREVLEYAGTLVKVKAGTVIFFICADIHVGWLHHGCLGRRCSRIYRISFSLSVASRIFWFPKVMLYQREQRRSSRDPRCVRG